MEYLRLVQLPGLPLTFKELGSTRAVSYFSKLSNIAVAEQTNCGRSDSVTKDCKKQCTMVC